MQRFNQYINEIAKVKDELEHSGRTFLQNLLTSIKQENGFNIEILHEGKRDKDGLGAPDFRINHTEKHTVVGYIENKKIGENLDKVLKSKQIEKYQKLTDNLILTDYLEWIWIYKGEIVKRERLCHESELGDKKFKLNAENIHKVQDIIIGFFSKEADRITKVKELAEKLARPSLELKKYLLEQTDIQIKNESIRDDLFAVYEIFKTGLFEELDTKDFADSFAQMLTYAIFLAKLNTNETLSIRNAKDHIPQAFSLIKTLVRFLDLLNEDKHKEIKWAVENILSVLNNIDAISITENLSSKHGDGEKDAYIYFYEDFLKEYDEEIRVSRGVYYTPPAVVEFITREVSSILEKDFNLPKGLANSKVKLLDFACGTGTFIFETFRQILQNTLPNSFERNDLIEKHLLKNIYGFEIMVSSYIIAHLKLSQFLKEQGYDIATKNDKRIGVYLTNTLENKQDIQMNFFAKAVAEEGKIAKSIKDDNEIIAIIGNPPYNVSSQNTLHDTNPLLKFHKNYKPKDETKLNIDDDYIKFIAFAHRKINEAGRGVVGVIVNNSFLKGLTHRKMRCELMNDFDKIYIIDLHGNARIGETTEDGSADQNVFDIMQGVCIIILVKNKDAKNKGVFHIDLYGKRNVKFKTLNELNRSQLTKLEINDFNKAFRSTKWGNERFIDDLSFFSPMKEATAMLEYGKFWGLTDVFGEYVSGIQTKNDEKFIHFQDDFVKTVESYDKSKIRNILYKPFDVRKCYYDTNLLGRARFTVMQHISEYDNIGLTFMRGFVGSPNFNQILITNNVADLNIYGFQTYLAPLYLHRTAKTEGLFLEAEEKKPNFKPEFARFVREKFGNPTPEEILAFIYAQMHSPAYRTKYLELLKIDFPRINFDVSLEEFKRLSAIGQELIDAHLMRKIPETTVGSCFDANGFQNTTVEKIIYNENEGRLYFNKTCYFADISPEVWNFKIGGYQVLDKYLKARKDMDISGDLEHVQNVIKVLAFTIERMKETG